MNGQAFHGDRPILDGKGDRLGHLAPAKHVATAILKFTSPEGLVLGLEGHWGSGKSSFVNLIAADLDSAEDKPEVIRFSPWLISSRTAMLDELFGEIAEAASKIPLSDDGGDAPEIREKRRRKLESGIVAFGKHLSTFGKAANAVGDAGVPGSGSVGKVLEGASEFLGAFGSSSLDALKERLKTELRHLQRKIVIFVDDLDRLEPAEAGEVVRLVRAVADFPNIVYVLCYSRSVLSDSLAKAYGVTDGNAYIDKIVQVSFAIPRPEAFDLRRMFREELERAFPGALSPPMSAEPRDTSNRLAFVIDAEGARTLRTPRDVARAINALRLYAGPVLSNIDLPDMLWLQFIRLRNHALYDWVEEYLNSAAAIAGGARIREKDIERIAERLRALIAAEGGDYADRMHELKHILPGIEHDFTMDDTDGWKLFKNLSGQTHTDAVQDRRLASDQHFRFYFALSKPSAALADSDFEQFLRQAATDQVAAIKTFRGYCETKRPQGGLLADALIDRLSGNAIARVPMEAIPGLLNALADAMDLAAITSGEGDWGRFWIWGPAEKLLEAGLKRLPRTEREALVKSLFESGKALGWLVSIFRSETFGHGIFGNRKKAENDRLLTEAEFAAVLKIMQKRFETTDAEELLITPHFVALLFAWRQSGPEGMEKSQRWVEAQSKDDESFLNLLEAMRQWSSVNGRVYRPLSREAIVEFLGLEAAEARLKMLVSVEEHKARAGELIKALNRSRD